MNFFCFMTHVTDVTCPVITPPVIEDFKRVIRHCVAGGNGTNRVFILGTTGCEPYVPFERKFEYVNAAVSEVAKLRSHLASDQNTVLSKLGKPLELAVGITGSCFEESRDLAQYCEEKSVDYAVFLPVFASRTWSHRAQMNSIKTMLQVIDSTDELKFIADNHRDRSGRNLNVNAWETLSKHPRIPELKDSSGDTARTRGYIIYSADNAVVSVWDEIKSLFMQNLSGVVAGSLNVLPVAWANAIRNNSNTALNPDEHESQKHRSWLINFQREYACNPIAFFHYALAAKGVISSAEMFDGSALTPDQVNAFNRILELEEFNELWGKN